MLVQEIFTPPSIKNVYAEVSIMELSSENLMQYVIKHIFAL